MKMGPTAPRRQTGGVARGCPTLPSPPPHARQGTPLARGRWADERFLSPSSSPPLWLLPLRAPPGFFSPPKTNKSLEKNPNLETHRRVKLKIRRFAGGGGKQGWRSSSRGGLPALPPPVSLQHLLPLLPRMRVEPQHPQKCGVLPGKGRHRSSAGPLAAGRGHLRPRRQGCTAAEELPEAGLKATGHQCGFGR